MMNNANTRARCFYFQLSATRIENLHVLVVAWTIGKEREGRGGERRVVRFSAKSGVRRVLFGRTVASRSPPTISVFQSRHLYSSTITDHQASIFSESKPHSLAEGVFKPLNSLPLPAVEIFEKFSAACAFFSILSFSSPTVSYYFPVRATCIKYTRGLEQQRHI